MDWDKHRVFAKNRTDKRIMQMLSRGQSPLQSATLPTSTLFSSIKRLMNTGYVIRTDTYDIEDPFFKRWTQQNS